MVAKKLILILCFLSSWCALASDRNEREFCDNILRIRNSEDYDAKAIFWRSIKLRFFPSLYARPKTIEMATSRHLSLSTNPENLKNIVFFVGLLAEQLPEAELAQLRYKELEAEFKKEVKKIKKVARAKTLDKCLQEIKKKNLNLERLNQISQELESGILADSKRMLEVNQFERELKQIQGGLSRDWLVFKVSHLEDVRQWLSSHKIANAVIVTHGKSSGHLIDSYHNQYPNGFFANISPTLYSLSLYNCYGKNTSETYDLENVLSSAPSMYQRRLLNIVKAPSENERDQVAPLKGFSNFMYRLDQRLNNISEDKISTSNSVLPRQCFMHVKADFSHGTAALALNRKFIGALRSHQASQLFAFPCEWKKSSENLLTVTNIAPSPWDLRNPPEIEIDGINPEIQVFHHSDSTLRSALYRF